MVQAEKDNVEGFAAVASMLVSDIKTNQKRPLALRI